MYQAPFQNWTRSGNPDQRFDPEWGSYYEYQIDRVDDDGGDYFDVWYDMSSKGGAICSFVRKADAKRAGVVPRVGGILRIYQHAPFCRIDGMTIDGKRLIWHGPEDHQRNADRLRAEAIRRDPGMAEMFDAVEAAMKRRGRGGRPEIG